MKRLAISMVEDSMRYGKSFIVKRGNAKAWWARGTSAGGRELIRCSSRRIPAEKKIRIREAEMQKIRTTKRRVF